MPSWSDSELAYLAGLLDGEGSIGLKSRGRRGGQSVCVTIYNTDRAIIDWLQLTFGGSVYVGKQRKENWRPSCAWSASNVKELLHSVKPFLIAKYEQADLVIDFMETAMPARSGRKNGISVETKIERGKIASRLAVLNARGYAVQDS